MIIAAKWYCVSKIIIIPSGTAIIGSICDKNDFFACSMMSLSSTTKYTMIGNRNGAKNKLK
jgi:hypothetical protein